MNLHTLLAPGLGPGCKSGTGYMYPDLGNLTPRTRPVELDPQSQTSGDGAIEPNPWNQTWTSLRPNIGGSSLPTGVLLWFFSCAPQA